MSVNQGSNALPIKYEPGYGDFKTTLDPYNINMYLEYGPISIYNDDRSLSEKERKTFAGWYFSPMIDGATISLFKGEYVVMYVQIQNPYDEGNYESWSCDTVYRQRDTEYVGHIYNYEYGSTLLDNDAVERDSATVADQTIDHPEYMRNGPWIAADSLSWYT